MTVVVDTNVLVSAALFVHSVPGRAVALVRRSGEFLTSVETLAELSEVLRRPRLDRIAPLDARLEVLADVILFGREVEIVTRVVACRDPDDDKFLDVAVNGNATHLVTGDQDLLALHPFRGVPILTPAAFLAALHPPAPGSPP
jgi:putative PIN family toxin of toxin-antitoxin system